MQSHTDPQSWLWFLLLFSTVWKFFLSLCWCKTFPCDLACGKPFCISAAYLACISCQATLVNLQFWSTVVATPPPLLRNPLLYNLPKSRRIGLMRLYCEKYLSVKAVRIASKITHFSHGEKSCIAQYALILPFWCSTCKEHDGHGITKDELSLNGLLPYDLVICFERNSDHDKHTAMTLLSSSHWPCDQNCHWKFVASAYLLPSESYK